MLKMNESMYTYAWLVIDKETQIKNAKQEEMIIKQNRLNASKRAQMEDSSQQAKSKSLTTSLRKNPKFNAFLHSACYTKISGSKLKSRSYNERSGSNKLVQCPPVSFTEDCWMLTFYSLFLIIVYLILLIALLKLNEDDYKLSMDIASTHNYFRSIDDLPPLQVDPMLIEKSQKMLKSNKDQAVLLYSSEMSNRSNTASITGHTKYETYAVDKRINTYEMSQHFYTGVHQYNFEQGECSKPIHRSNWNHCNQFAQMMWKGTLFIGCASQPNSKQYDNNRMSMNHQPITVVCHYYPPGNVPGQFKQNVMQTVALFEKSLQISQTK